ncbi:MarR family winged helix-turn-helix transcriptional regulator [Lentzea nigeriaca]|uniref:MarR family winged helix-turn-helix transcriptional regulator n=1 Tax=Lentzea nigeriaca TaxID=1128665 RepID=UPI00195F207C|nr:MarR family winged helix-turn-helix transcriptional regulator [Lentzea nigeriaca]MBM7856240.1 DNA-binding MarR family transcriptional regulator [Lentzea nigeriaca]
MLRPADRPQFVERLGRVARIEEADVAGQQHEAGVLLMRATPGYLIRRAQQVHTTLWSATVSEVTGPQYAVLAAVVRLGTADQSGIGEAASLDSSSTADVVARPSAGGWLTKETAPDDRRRMRIKLTTPGRAALHRSAGPVEAVQSQVLAPLKRDERAEFIGKASLSGNAAPDVRKSSPLGTTSTSRTCGMSSGGTSRCGPRPE